MPRYDNAEIDLLIGKRLKERRVELGMTQKQLGDALGMSFQQIQKYEAGKNSIAVATLLKVSTILDIPPTYFFSDIPIPHDTCLTAFPFAYKPTGRISIHYSQFSKHR